MYLGVHIMRIGSAMNKFVEGDQRMCGNAGWAGPKA